MDVGATMTAALAFAAGIRCRIEVGAGRWVVEGAVVGWPAGWEGTGVDCAGLGVGLGVGDGDGVGVGTADGVTTGMTRGVLAGVGFAMGTEIGSAMVPAPVLPVGWPVAGPGALDEGVADGVGATGGAAWAGLLVFGMEVGLGALVRCGEGTMTGPPVPVVTAKLGTVSAGWVAAPLGVTALEPSTMT